MLYASMLGMFQLQWLTLFTGYAKCPHDLVDPSVQTKVIHHDNILFLMQFVAPILADIPAICIILST